MSYRCCLRILRLAQADGRKELLLICERRLCPPPRRGPKSPCLLGRSLPIAVGGAPDVVAAEHLRSVREDRVHPGASQPCFLGS
jgi:hypothetical protein